MKKFAQKVIAFMLAAAMVFTAGVFPAADEVQAAGNSVYINPYSDTVVTYKPGDGIKNNWSVISIVGCEKKSQIKNLKSSNKNMKVERRDGYIVVNYGDKAQKTTITCTVKGVKLKTVFTVKKYTSPVKSFKIGKTNATSQFKKTDVVKKGGKTYKNQNLSVQVKSGWKINFVSVYNGGKTKHYSNVNSTKFSKKITLKGTTSYVVVQCVNAKTKITENLQFAY